MLNKQTIVLIGVIALCVDLAMAAPIDVQLCSPQEDGYLRSDGLVTGFGRSNTRYHVRVFKAISVHSFADPLTHKTSWFAFPKKSLTRPGSPLEVVGRRSVVLEHYEVVTSTSSGFFATKNYRIPDSMAVQPRWLCIDSEKPTLSKKPQEVSRSMRPFKLPARGFAPEVVSTWMSMLAEKEDHLRINCRFTGGVPPFKLFFDFGNGDTHSETTSKRQFSVTHRYPHQGTYTAKLSVTDARDTGIRFTQPVMIGHHNFTGGVAVLVSPPRFKPSSTPLEPAAQIRIVTSERYILGFRLYITHPNGRAVWSYKDKWIESGLDMPLPAFHEMNSPELVIPWSGWLGSDQPKNPADRVPFPPTKPGSPATVHLEFLSPFYPLQPTSAPNLRSTTTIEILPWTYPVER